MRVVKTENLAVNYAPIQLPTNKLEWVQYGQDNQYPNFLMDLMNKSSIHSAIQHGKQELTVGDGLIATNKDAMPTDMLVALDKFMNRPNPNETLEDLYFKIAYDLIIFGGYALQVIWSKDRESIAEIYHMDFSKIRAGKIDEDTNKIEYYYFSDDWAQYKKDKYVPKSIKAYDVENRKDPVQLIYYKNYQPGMPYYPAPMYTAAIPYVLLDNEIGEYHLNAMKNGLSPNYILNVGTGIPSDEEQDDFYRNFKREMTGSGGRKIMITFSEGKEQAPEIIPIGIQDEHQKFITLNESVIQNLLTANRLTSPMLMGIKTPGELGGRTEMVDAFEIYYNTVIAKLQKQLNRTLNEILRINNIISEIEVIKPTLVASSLSEAVLSRVLKIDELREQIGYEVLPDSTGDRLLG